MIPSLHATLARSLWNPLVLVAALVLTTAGTSAYAQDADTLIGRAVLLAATFADGPTAARGSAPAPSTGSPCPLPISSRSRDFLPSWKSATGRSGRCRTTASAAWRTRRTTTSASTRSAPLSRPPRAAPASSRCSTSSSYATRTASLTSPSPTPSRASASSPAPTSTSSRSSRPRTAPSGSATSLALSSSMWTRRTPCWGHPSAFPTSTMQARRSARRRIRTARKPAPSGS